MARRYGWWMAPFTVDVVAGKRLEHDLCSLKAARRSSLVELINLDNRSFELVPYELHMCILRVSLHVLLIPNAGYQICDLIQPSPCEVENTQTEIITSIFSAYRIQFDHHNSVAHSKISVAQILIYHISIPETRVVRVVCVSVVDPI